MTRHTFLSALALSTCLIAPAEAREVVIGLSPFGTTEEKLADIRTLTTHLLATLEPGETGWLVDAFTQLQIASLTVPEDPDVASSDKRIMRANRAFFVDAKRYAESARSVDGDNFTGQIDFPALLRTVGANYPASEPRDLILYRVSPITHDPRSPDLSMLSGHVPDDGMIAAPRLQVVYGSDGEEDLLSNYTVHWGTDGNEWALSDRHSAVVQRYLALSISERDSVLATFAPDPSAALRNAATGLDRPVGTYVLKPTDEPAMMAPGAVTARVERGRDVSIYERHLSTRTPTRSELAEARDVEIAIRWTCACDFDLAVQPAGRDIISYRDDTTTEGHLEKDFTSSDALNNGWETVILPGPVDLSNLTVAVNLFSGTGLGQSVEARLAIQGETWGQMFLVPGPADSGGGLQTTMREGHPENTAWKVIDIDALVRSGQ